MSFRTKAREVTERGKEERGDFTPKADSIPVKMYNYWLNESDSKKAHAIRMGTRRENFCHYWRVVAIWAPLRFLFEKGLDLLDYKAFWTVLATVVVFGFILGALTVDGWLLFFLKGIGVGLVIAGCVGVLLGGTWFLAEFIPEKFPRLTKRWTSFWKSGKTWLTIAGLSLATFVVGTSWGTGFTGPLIWLTIFASLGIIAYGIVWAVDYFKGKDAIKFDEWNALSDEDKYQLLLWKIAVNDIERKPSKFELKAAAFFRGIGDFFVFIVQVVRVNKWKVCPLVEIPKVDKTSEFV